MAGSVFRSCFETEYVVPSLGPKAPRADLRASSEDCPCASCEPRLGFCRKAMSTASGIVTSPAGRGLLFPDESVLPLKTGTAALPEVLTDGEDDAAKASPQPKGPASAPTTRKNRLSSGMRFIYLLRKKFRNPLKIILTQNSYTAACVIGNIYQRTIFYRNLLYLSFNKKYYWPNKRIKKSVHIYLLWYKRQPYAIVPPRQGVLKAARAHTCKYK